MAISALLLSRDARHHSSRVRFYAYRGALERVEIAHTIALFVDDDYVAAGYANALVRHAALRAYERRLP